MWKNTRTSSTLWIDPAKTSSDLTTLISYDFLKIFIYLLLYHSWFSFKKKTTSISIRKRGTNLGSCISQGTPPHTQGFRLLPIQLTRWPSARCNCRDCSSTGDLQTEAGFRSPSFLVGSRKNPNTKFRNSKV